MLRVSDPEGKPGQKKRATGKAAQYVPWFYVSYLPADTRAGRIAGKGKAGRFTLARYGVKYPASHAAGPGGLYRYMAIL